MLRNSYVTRASRLLCSATPAASARAIMSAERDASNRSARHASSPGTAISPSPVVTSEDDLLFKCLGCIHQEHVCWQRARGASVELSEREDHRHLPSSEKGKLAASPMPPGGRGKSSLRGTQQASFSWLLNKQALAGWSEWQVY